MADLASVMAKIQVEETQFKAVVSESTIQKIGQTLNYAIDHFTIPPGIMMDYAAAAAPSGWLACDGSAVSEVTYADLFAVIGTLYNTGGEGAGNFRLPNFTGRYARGSGGGKTTGEYLAAAVPGHTHSFADGDAYVFKGAGAFGAAVGSEGRTTISGTTGSTAVGDGTEVRPATVVVTKIIKY